MSKPNPEQIAFPEPEIVIVDQEAAISAIRNISGEWLERTLQRGSHTRMVEKVEILAPTQANLLASPAIQSHVRGAEMAEGKADDYTIAAEADIAQAVGIPATVQLDPSRGTILRRVTADRTDEQPTLDRAIQAGWARYGGADNTKQRERVLRGKQLPNFNTHESDEPEFKTNGLDPDKLIPIDKGKHILTPEALLGAQLLLKGMTLASAINVSESAQKQGIRRDPNHSRVSSLPRPEHLQLLNDHSLEELEAMEKTTLLKAAQYAKQLKQAGLLPPVIRTDTPDLFISDMQVEFHLPNTPEREKAKKHLAKILERSMAPERPPKLKKAQATQDTAQESLDIG